jgi:hypothetical protein
MLSTVTNKPTSKVLSTVADSIIAVASLSNERSNAKIKELASLSVILAFFADLPLDDVLAFPSNAPLSIPLFPSLPNPSIARGLLELFAY